MKMRSPNSSKRRHYFMALFAKRRTPIRVAKAEQCKARIVCREWWEVEAVSALAARKLCLAWPMLVESNNARITNHGRNRT